MNNLLTIRRNQLVNRYVAGYTCLGVETGIFRWLLLPGKMSGAEFEELAARHGVQVYAAERFATKRSAAYTCTPCRAANSSNSAPDILPGNNNQRKMPVSTPKHVFLSVHQKHLKSLNKD